MPICDACGQQNREQARFCGSCGQPLQAVILEPSEEVTKPIAEKKDEKGRLTTSRAYLSRGVVRKHIDHAVATFLAPDEILLGAFDSRPVSYSERSAFSIHNYLLITDQRVIFWNRSRKEGPPDSFSYGDISNVQGKEGFILGKLILTVGRRTVRFKIIEKSDLSIVTQLIRDHSAFPASNEAEKDKEITAIQGLKHWSRQDWYGALGWGFGLFFGIAGLGAVGEGTILTALLSWVLALVLLPPAWAFIREKTGRPLSPWTRTLVIISLVILLGMLSDHNEQRKTQVVLQEAQQSGFSSLSEYREAQSLGIAEKAKYDEYKQKQAKRAVEEEAKARRAAEAKAATKKEEEAKARRVAEAKASSETSFTYDQVTKGFSSYLAMNRVEPFYGYDRYVGKTADGGIFVSVIGAKNNLCQAGFVLTKPPPSERDLNFLRLFFDNALQMEAGTSVEETILHWYDNTLAQWTEYYRSHPYGMSPDELKELQDLQLQYDQTPWTTGEEAMAAGLALQHHAADMAEKARVRSSKEATIVQGNKRITLRREGGSIKLIVRPFPNPLGDVWDPLETEE